MATRDINSNSKLPPTKVISTENKKQDKDPVVKHPFVVGDLIDKLNSLSQEYRSSKLVVRTDDGAMFVDKIEFTACEVDEKKHEAKVYYEIKLSSELGIKAY